MFAIFYWIVDVKGWKKWTPIFTVVGMNSITIYMVQRIVDMRGINRFFFRGLSELLPQQWGSVLISATYVLVCWLLLYFLYKKKIFLKV
jgi:predicted acyltransferase